jgi:hypothetical protein
MRLLSAKLVLRPVGHEPLPTHDRNLHDRGQDQDEAAVLFAGYELLDERLHHFGTVEKPVEVHEHQQRGILGFGPLNSAQTANRRERIGAGRVALACPVPVNGRRGVNVPGDEAPFLMCAELSDVAQGIVMFVAFDSNAREARAHVLRQALRERHKGIPLMGWLWENPGRDGDRRIADDGNQPR